MKFAQQLLLICLAGAALGCGQKGPLVMPDQQKHKRTIPTAPGAAKPSNGAGTNPAPPASGAPPPSSQGTPTAPTSTAPTPPSSDTPPPADAAGR